MATKAERRAAEAMGRAMARLEWDLHSEVTRAGRVPEAWREVWQERSAVKERVTLRVDRDVMRFFRSMGAGHGPRMNTVLRAFMEARLAGLLEGEDLMEGYRETWMGEPKPDRSKAAWEKAKIRAELEETMRELDRVADVLRGQPKGHVGGGEVG